MKPGQEQHAASLPTPRKIRRACGNELYRTVKRLHQHVPAELVEEAERRYTNKVIAHLVWITQNHSNRKLLADWWEENVCAEIAELWHVEPSRLAKAFREAFGG
jgi:hypothetical protein